MAADDFEYAWACLLAFISNDKCDNRGCISSIEVTFTWLKVPFINFFNLGEVIFQQLILDILNSMEVGHT